MTATNTQIVQHLRDVAYLMEQAGEPWKAKAYSSGADSIEGLIEPLNFDARGKLKVRPPKVGDGIAYTIEEFFAKGNSTKYQELLARGLPPPSTRELQRIPQVGAVTARKLWQKFKIRSLAEFGEKLAEIEKYPEFAKYIPGYTRVANAPERLPAYQVRQVVDRLLAAFPEEIDDVGYAGSMRRGAETVRDVDVIVCLKNKNQKPILLKALEDLGITPDVRAGESKWGLTVPVLDQSVVLDLNFCSKENRGAYYNYLTGSREFNEAVRGLAKKKGYRLNEHGLFDLSGTKLIDALAQEEDLFTRLKLPWVPPECRSGPEALEQNSFEGLISADQLMADFHCHSLDSDGGASWEQLVEAAMKNKFACLGVSDHSHGSGNGPKAEEKLRLIQNFKKFRRSSPIPLYYGAEIDVRASGDLDYPLELISKLDYCLFALHHSYDKKVTERYIGAMEGLKPKFPKLLAHPTGRQIGSRPGCEADWPKIFDTCKRTNTILEINGQPDRQDLPPDLAYEATKAGVYVMINSDCHGVNFRGLLSVGTSCARRGWVMSERVVNARQDLIDRWLNGALYQ